MKIKSYVGKIASTLLLALNLSCSSHYIDYQRSDSDYNPYAPVSSGLQSLFDWDEINMRNSSCCVKVNRLIFPEENREAARNMEEVLREAEVKRAQRIFEERCGKDWSSQTSNGLYVLICK